MNRKIFSSLFAETNTFPLIVLCNSILTKITSTNQVGKSQKCHWVGEGGIYDKLALNWKFTGSGCSKAKVSSVWPSDPGAKYQVVKFCHACPRFFLFSCLFFCWTFNRLHFDGRRFLGKLLGLQNQMKGTVGGQWKSIFMEIFSSMLHVFFFFSLVSLTELNGLNSSLCISQWTKLSLTIEIDDVTSSRSDDVGRIG